MGVLVEYFVAPDDRRAALTVDWVGGPSGGPIRTWPRRAGVGYPTLDAPGIDPFIGLAMLEQFLTGRTWEHQQEDPSSRPIVAEGDGGAPLVVRISNALVDAVVGVADLQVQPLAEEWAQIEEFDGQLDPIVLTHFVTGFRALAVQARAGAGGVYCWVCT